eukprot:CAMPEP_0197247142 /NCGR_PEP_ID=MMETSP1429-20130617/26132_1 /TAXON_ID=49237 /ORGANISM="Chaetoceros  sp., Strain UNC1202" /LENGTH=141 /DNA_ID=CAMNT_0042707977 /DNA_START=141 /DNA_END=567 /DNA_ORIENTATION=+
MSITSDDTPIKLAPDVVRDNSIHCLGQYDKTIKNHEEALAISHEIGDGRGEGRHLCNLGDAFHCLGQYAQAIENYEKALEISREIGDEAAKDNVFAGLAMLSASSGSMISREIGDKGGERNHLGNLDSSYYGEGVNDEAIK